jgi:Fur family transcriptional regulator, ferric uptake regulator
MTASHAGTALPVHDLDAAIAAMRSRGLRVSAARRLVLEALFRAEGPVTAEEIADGLGGRVPVSDLGSTYRNLETLEEIGLIRHVHLGHGPGRYAPAAREYLVCEECGTVMSVPPGALDDVRDAVRSAFAFEASFAHFPIVGRCGSCA